MRVEIHSGSDYREPAREGQEGEGSALPVDKDGNVRTRLSADTYFGFSFQKLSDEVQLEIRTFLKNLFDNW